jgi:ribonucleoside-diphosphate reductase alpha chain
MSSPALGLFADLIFKRTYAIKPSETWEGCASRVSNFIANGDAGLEKEFFDVISTRKFIPGGRYLYASGRKLPQLTNCFLLKAEDSREGWGKLLDKHVRALSTGGGVGTEYSLLRPKGAPIKRFGGVSGGPISLMSMVNEVARHVMAGGKRRSALWAGLAWDHPDIEEFITAKNWATAVKAMKETDLDFPAMLDMTNISVRLDDEFFKKVKKDQDVWNLYYKICKNMCKTGEPGFSVNVKESSRDILRNPCGEVVSDTDSDSCNLGSVNLSRIDSLEELERVVRIAVRFLYNGTYLSELPHEDFVKVREDKRRIGLGLMGLHEWLIVRGLEYKPSGKLGRWLSTWQAVSDEEAAKYSRKCEGGLPVAIRALAPTGTIGIIGETTTGIEPIFCVAYKRRYLDGDGSWKSKYVIDPTAERAITKLGVDPEDIEDSFSLSKNVEKRISMQAFVQDFTDQAISSTINCPEWGEYGNSNAKKFAETLLKYLPLLRGITVYPDGARSGQPFVPIKYETAKKHADTIFKENEDRCSGGVCGI